ncbi:MAG TPA: dihydrolipoyl dehydrogenase [Methanoregulaceae archaeon]|nr:dihydrolipoyl dehydrogenase [Methanolinea sp.]MDD3090717.1 dihydrolipoyl dehydrogenase [Methanoregulaceae archaeon]HOP67199.1 dihydrolipoyl dehydrogenase [Methanoregulaceae archaeon]HPJ73938.1 dihydrolipoyl dehydrogenase [Methanoregulaceae archaeon]HPQ75792.1 dihydrolipoyl dehydrogenase [Methanoregulaceae archaeon]
MKSYDVLVVGSGAGGSVASMAIRAGLRTALVDRGPPGGTCVNTGCIPSKMLIYPADVIESLRGAERLGVTAGDLSIRFRDIMERMRETRSRNSSFTRSWIQQNTERLDFYEGEGRFLDDHVMEVDGRSMQAEKIFICTGARPAIPPVEGLDGVPYLTNESVLELDSTPADLAIIGGGYVATEYAHFFAAMGTRVTVVQRNRFLVPEEEEEISLALADALGKRMTLLTGTEVTSVRGGSGDIHLYGHDTDTGEDVHVQAGTVLVATGRRSNADTLGLENTEIEIDRRGYIVTNEYLETSVENIWAVGDANGRQMFRHAANREASIAWHNATRPEKTAMDYWAVPHAVYSYPQVASVGLTERAARIDHHVLVGKAHYRDIAKGEAMGEERGFAKIIVDKETDRILGFHLIGPQAPILIQEIVNAMNRGDTVEALSGIHIHPSLSEIVPAVLRHLTD